MQSAGSKSTHEHQRPWWRPSPIALAGLAILIGLLLLVLHAHSISHDISMVIRHFRIDRLPWLGVALATEGLSFLCYALVQRSLLTEGGARLTLHDMVILSIAATGLTNLLPGGTAPSSGWLTAQYRKRGIPMPLAMWAVLAGGYAAVVSVLLLTLVGATIARLLPLIASAICLVLLAAGSVGFLVAFHQLEVLDRRIRSKHRGRFDGLLTRLSKSIGDASTFRASPAVGLRVLVLSLGNWGLDVGCLIASFALLGLPIPWTSVLFAYSLAQIAGSLAPVPGGIGFVEGGMVGAFALAGTPVGGAILATLLYRLITTFGIAGIGSFFLLYLSRQKSTRQAHLIGKAAALSDD